MHGACPAMRAMPSPCTPRPAEQHICSRRTISRARAILVPINDIQTLGPHVIHVEELAPYFEPGPAPPCPLTSTRKRLTHCNAKKTDARSVGRSRRAVSSAPASTTEEAPAARFSMVLLLRDAGARRGAHHRPAPWERVKQSACGTRMRDERDEKSGLQRPCLRVRRSPSAN